MKEIYDILAEVARRPGETFALATLVHAEGSSYRRPGARMLICADSTIIGSLSGGCLEEEVAVRGRDVLETGKPAMMTFDMRRRFGCHGKIDIFIERAEQKLFADLSAHIDARSECVITTTHQGSFVEEAASLPPDEMREAGSFPCRQEIHPQLRVLLFGEGPDSAPLRSFCRALGWEAVDVFDADSLPSQADPWTAAVVKSHNYGRDFAALRKLLPLNLPYVGLIGPRKRRDQLLNDLLDIGVAINAGFFAPAGIDLQAETPEEIALSIVAEIQRTFAGGSGHSLRERKLSIHAGAHSTECKASAR